MLIVRIVLLACVFGLVVGCAGGSTSAEDITCKTFGRMSDREQDATVSRLLEERGEADGPSVTKSLNRSTTRLQISTGCFSSDGKKTKIGTLVD